MTDPFGEQSPTPPQAPGPPQPAQPPVAPGMAPQQPLQQPPGALPPPGYPAPSVPPATGYMPPGYPQPGAEAAAPPYAGFGTRLLALVLDAIIFSLIIASFTVPLVVWSIVSYETDPSGCDLDLDAGCEVAASFVTVVIISALLWLLLVLVAIVLYYIRPVARTGQTLGRMMLNIRVVNELTGEPPGWGKSIVRYLVASFISSNLFWLGYLWCLWDDKNQTWHDKIAGTIVTNG